MQEWASKISHIHVHSSISYQITGEFLFFEVLFLSLLSSAVVTFSPIASLREEVERANDDESPASE